AVVPFVTALTLGLACTADDPVARPVDADAAVAAPLEPPSVESVPERTPLTQVAVRGKTVGARIVSTSSSGTRVTAVLPGGMFCQDAPIATGATTALEVYAVGGDGRVSAPAVVEVVHDPDAPPPAAPSCAGSEGGMCQEAEVCGSDDRDENCD